MVVVVVEALIEVVNDDVGSIDDGTVGVNVCVVDVVGIFVV